jgi:hypothetical protein
VCGVWWRFLYKFNDWEKKTDDLKLKKKQKKEKSRSVSSASSFCWCALVCKTGNADYSDIDLKKIKINKIMTR